MRRGYTITVALQFLLNLQIRALELRRLKEDPMWPRLWIYNETAKVNMNIMKAWALGTTGKGVVVAIVDDGLQIDHPELAMNFDPRASYDFLDKDRNPSTASKYSHGTRLAGIVAANGNKLECGLGIAHGTKLGGIRMLRPGGITPSTEASALAFARDYIDIYSVSWGPGDDGIKVGKPPFLTRWVLQMGATVGRRGKGSIYVWASGNGGRHGDHCGSDGYVNNPYTLAVAGVASTGRAPWYSERCAATLTSAVTSRSHTLVSPDFDLFTTETGSKCVGTMGATSTAAPIVASIIALGLQVNPSLTWRDIQHLLIVSSSRDHLDSTDWQRNGAGFWFNVWFGYGALDAERFVRNAAHHRLLPPAVVCTSKPFAKNYRLSGYKRESTFRVSFEGCLATMQRVEQAALKVTIAYQQRGMMSLTLRSPMGTESEVLGTRIRDRFYLSYIDWEFLSVHFWDESPKGDWEVVVRLSGRRESRGMIYSGKLILYGSR